MQDEKGWQLRPLKTTKEMDYALIKHALCGVCTMIWEMFGRIFPHLLFSSLMTIHKDSSRLFSMADDFMTIFCSIR